MSFVIPPEIQTNIAAATGWLWDSHGKEWAEKAAKRGWDKARWRLVIEKYYTSLFERVGFVRILGRMESEPLNNVFTHVNLLDKLSAENRYDLEKLKTDFAPRDFDRFSRVKRVPGDAAVAQHQKLFILGKPGAGKTTFLKHVALQAIKGEVDGIPIFISLKELSDSGKEIVEFINHQFEVHQYSNPEAFVERVLKNGDGLVLLDGLDEVNLEGDQRSQMIDMLNDFAYQYSDCQMLMTCRVAATDYSFTQFEYAEMADFDADQMARYIDLWFVGNEAKRESCKAELLENKANKSVRELAQTPLLLALLCLVYEERHEFPKDRDEIYAEATRALLVKWDSSRNISRDVVYKELSLKHKERMLSHIAGQTFEAGDYFLKEAALEKMIEDYLKGVPKLEEPDAHVVLRAMEAQHGILVERAARIHSFSHLTLQEYYKARYIVENETRGTLTRLMFHVGDDRWREVFLLTAGMLEDATEFCELYLEAVWKLIAADAQLVSCIEWAVEKGAMNTARFGAAAKRSFLIYLALALALALARGRDRAIDLALALAIDRAIDLDRDLARAIDLDLDLAIDLDRDLARTLARDRARAIDLDLAIDLDRDLARDLDLARALALARDRARAIDLDLDLDRDLARALARDLARALQVSEQFELTAMQVALEELTVPDVDINTEQGLDAWNGFATQLDAILTEYEDQWNPYKMLAVDKSEVDERWDWSKEQAELMRTYYDANLLLVRCKEVAYLPDRDAIKDRILLPYEAGQV